MWSLSLIHIFADKVVEERLRARVGVRLEGADHALIAHGLRRGEQRVELGGVVGIVVEHVRAVERTLALEAAARAVERGETLLHGAAGDAQHIGSRGRGEGVEDVVPPGDVQLLSLIHI